MHSYFVQGSNESTGISTRSLIHPPPFYKVLTTSARFNFIIPSVITRMDNSLKWEVTNEVGKIYLFLQRGGRPMQESWLWVQYVLYICVMLKFCSAIPFSHDTLFSLIIIFKTTRKFNYRNNPGI